MLYKRQVILLYRFSRLNILSFVLEALCGRICKLRPCHFHIITDIQTIMQAWEEISEDILTCLIHTYIRHITQIWIIFHKILLILFQLCMHKPVMQPYRMLLHMHYKSRTPSIIIKQKHLLLLQTHQGIHMI